MNSRVACTLVSVVGLLGCSTPDGEMQGTEVIDADSLRPIGREPEFRTLLRTLPWLEEFELGSRTCQGEMLTQQKAAFSGGETIHLSMRVNDAPRGTVVTSYWYGPGNESLGYEKKTIASELDRLRFFRDDTRTWQRGAYRVEVWIGDIKLRGISFDIIGTRTIDTIGGGRSPGRPID